MENYEIKMTHLSVSFLHKNVPCVMGLTLHMALSIYIYVYICIYIYTCIYVTMYTRLVITLLL